MKGHEKELDVGRKSRWCGSVMHTQLYASKFSAFQITREIGNCMKKSKI